MFPTEIWIQIIRIAVTSWPDSSFNPRSDNLDCVEGFSKASSHFRAVVDAVRCENIVGSTDHFVFLSSPCWMVQYLEILEPLPERLLSTKTFHENLSDYSQLKSLSICSPEPSLTILDLQSLSFANTLRRLDFRIYPDGRFLLNVPISFPNLVELRLGAREFLKGPKEWSLTGTRSVLDLCSFRISSPADFATNLASCLSGSRNLRVLSIHMALDDERDLRTLIALHELNVHRAATMQNTVTVPHDREYFNCVTCTKTYDHNAVACREDSATRILAQGLPKLERVLWTNAWREISEDESAQRGTTIVREGQDIRLSRDDDSTRVTTSD